MLKVIDGQVRIVKPGAALDLALTQPLPRHQELSRRPESSPAFPVVLPRREEA